MSRRRNLRYCITTEIWMNEISSGMMKHIALPGAR